MTGRLGLLQMGISMALLECLYNMVAGFPQSTLSKRPSQKLQCLLGQLQKPSTVTSAIFYQSHSWTLIQYGRGLHRHGHQEGGSLWTILEAGLHSWGGRHAIVGEMLWCRCTTGSFLWQLSLARKGGGEAWAQSWRKRTLAWCVRKWSVQGRRKCRRKGTEARLSMYPGSLKDICWPGAKADRARTRSYMRWYVSTALSVWEWRGDGRDKLWHWHLHSQVKLLYIL